MKSECHVPTLYSMCSIPTTSTSNQPTDRKWIYVTRRFERFVDNLAITSNQMIDGETKHHGVRNCLNLHYHQVDSETANSILTGSWGKELRVRPPRDIDVLFVLPWDVYDRFELRLGNKQSQLLQEVKGVLAAKYSETDMRGDGQAVVVRFASMPVEVVPAFPATEGRFLICDTAGEGSYRLTDPNAEFAQLDASDTANANVTRRLVRMAKQWQRNCSVPLKSFMIEHLVVQFMREWTGMRDYFWYDWLVRDFFLFLTGKSHHFVVMPGTGQQIPLGDAWLSRANTAYGKALKACEYEKCNENLLAGIYWHDIFGDMIPMNVE